MRHGVNGFLTDFWNSTQLADYVAGVLEHRQKFDCIRQAARATILDGYERGKQTAIICRHVEKIVRNLKK